MPISDYNASAALNVLLGTIPVGPGMEREKVNNAFQQLMADIAGFRGISGAGLTGYSDAENYAVSTSGDVLRNRIYITSAPYNCDKTGVASSTAGFTAAALEAATRKAELIIPPGTFLINDYIPIRNGVKAVIGFGGIIKLATGSIGGVLLQGKNIGLATNVTNCTVQGLVIDMNGTIGIPIYASAPISCKFMYNQIYGCDNAQAGIFIKAFNTSAEASRDNLIAFNIIDGGANAVSSGIQLTSEATHAVRDNKVIGNTTFGWQYGVGLGENSPKNQIGFHRSFGSSRGISIQNGCDDTTVDNCLATEFTQVAVHVVNSLRVRVTNCKAFSQSVVTGEGTFQAYKNVKGTTFINCETHIPSSSGTGPEFHFYAGASASEVTFINCKAIGIASRSYFCLESAYKTAAYSAYGRNKSGVIEADATDDTRNAGFKDCVVDGTSLVPAYAFLQVTLTGAVVRALTRPIFEGCRSIGDSYSHHLFAFEETASNLSGGTCIDFSTQSGVADAKFTLPRGTAHFVNIGGSVHTPLNFYTATVTFSNSWVTFGATSPLTVRKDQTGRVFVNGAVKDGVITAATVMATLPVGFRPVNLENTVQFSNGAAGFIRFNTAGTIEIVSGANALGVYFNASFPSI